ncbi:MAG: SIMPL domain-containing protein [Stenomitos frigidus ULC029]
MERREQFALLSLLSTLTFTSWIGQTSIAKADDRVVAQRIAAPSCQPATTSASSSSPPNGCTEMVIERRSLTVVGLGQVRAPADIALLEFRFGSRAALNAPESNVPGLSIEAARKNTETDLQPAVKALTETGTPSRNVSLQTSSLQSPALFVRVEKPTQEGLQKTVLTVNQALKSSQSLFVQSIGAGYAVNSCQFLQRSARRVALRDAQEQLTSLAQEVGVQLGELLSVTVLPFQGSSNSISCGSKVGVSNTLMSIAIDDATPPYNPSDQPEVQVKSQVSVTHAIKP